MDTIIDKDERYPDYSLSDYWSYGGSKAWISESDLKFIRRAEKMYDQAQDILERAYKRGKLYDPS